MHPGKMIVGMIVCSIILLAFAYVSTEGRAVHNLKKKYPGSGIVLMMMAGCFLTYTLGSLLVFLLGIMLPFSGNTVLTVLILSYTFNIYEK